MPGLLLFSQAALPFHTPITISKKQAILPPRGLLLLPLALEHHPRSLCALTTKQQRREVLNGVDCF